MSAPAASYADVKRKGGANARSAAMICNEPAFQQWLDRRQNKPVGTNNATTTTEWLRGACKVVSRADLDHDDYGASMFKKIMRTYFDEREA